MAKKKVKVSKAKANVSKADSSGQHAEKHVKIKPALKEGSSKARVGYWRIVKDSLKFGFSFDKLAVLWLVSSPIILLVMWMLKVMLSVFGEDVLLGITPIVPGTITPEVVAPLAAPMLLIFLYLLILLFLRPFLDIGVVDSAASFVQGKKKSYWSSLKSAAPRYGSALGALFLVIAIVIALFISIIALAALSEIVAGIFAVLALLLMLFCLFVYLPIIVVEGKGAFESFKASASMFFKKPGIVIVMCLVLIAPLIVLLIFENLIKWLLMLLFGVPVAQISAMFSNAAAAGASQFSPLAAYETHFFAMTSASLVAQIASVYISLFLFAVMTLFYLRMKKL